MKTVINTKKALIWGAVVFIIHVIIMNSLWMSPPIASTFNEFSGHPSMKPMESFGGTGIWVGLNSVFGLFFTGLLIWLFLLLFRSLPGRNFSKGLFYGGIIALLKAVPEAFNQWMLVTPHSFLNNL